MAQTIMKALSSALQATGLILAVAGFACGKPQRVELTGPIDSVTGVLEIANGYGGKLMILSHPKITTPLRNIVRVDSFYVDPSRPGGKVRPPRYQRLLHWPATSETDTVGGNPAVIVDVDDPLGGRPAGYEQLFSPFNPAVRQVGVDEDILTIGVLTPFAAIAKYGEHGRNGAIVMTLKSTKTKMAEYPEESAWPIPDLGEFQEAVWDTTQSWPGIVDVRFAVDTTGHVDPKSFVIICRTPGAFVEAAKKDVLLRSVWKPARLHGRPVREVRSFGLRTPVDPTRTAGDSISLCYSRLGVGLR